MKKTANIFLYNFNIHFTKHLTYDCVFSVCQLFQLHLQASWTAKHYPRFGSGCYFSILWSALFSFLVHQFPLAVVLHLSAWVCSDFRDLSLLLQLTFQWTPWQLPGFPTDITHFLLLLSLCLAFPHLFISTQLLKLLFGALWISC